MTPRARLERARRLMNEAGIRGYPDGDDGSEFAWVTWERVWLTEELASLALDGMPATGPYRAPPCVLVSR